MEKNMTRLTLFSLALVLWRGSLPAQTLEFSVRTWQVSAKTASLENYKGRPCVLLAQGSLKLAEAGFTNGVIEFDIANFSYRADANVKLQGEIKTLAVAPPGTIMAWQVSEAF